MTRGRLWVVVGLGAAMAGCLVQQAWFAPAIDFLRPAIRGRWIVHPQPPPGPAFQFVHRFTLTNMPARVDLRITALREFEFQVNGQPVPHPAAANWKVPVTVEVGPLLQPGTNEFQILVKNSEGPPALLVEGPPFYRSDRRWQVTLVKPGNGPQPAAVAGADERFLSNKEHPLWHLPRSRWYAVAAAAWLVFLAYALVPVRFKPWMKPVPPPSPAGSFWRRHGYCLALFLAVAVVDLHNARVYLYSRNYFDWQGHVDYIRFVAQHWRVPLATNGWEMFQAPLYYFKAAAVYRLFGGAGHEVVALKAVQFVSTAAGLGLLAVSWLLLRLVFPENHRARNAGFTVAAVMPVCRYLNPTITNEVMAGTVIALGLWLAAWLGSASQRRLWQAVVVGAVCGLALLTKATAVFLLLSLAIWLFLQSWRRRDQPWRWAVLAIGVALLVGGWFYARNYAVFGNLVIGNWDQASGFRYHQPPGYRAAAFYARFGGALTHLPERSCWSSFWDGMYGSAWGDIHGSFLPIGNLAAQSVQTIIFWLALGPTLGALLGFGRALRDTVRDGGDHPYQLLLLHAAVSVAGLILYTMKLPHYSVIKAFFLLSLVPSFGVFAGLGLDALARQLGRLRWVLYAGLAALVALILPLFWYRGT